MNNNKEIKKIGTILSDTGKSNLKEFDIVFLIDATSSMGPYIEAAKLTAENISKSLRQKFPETNFQYGYVFYRDPIDSFTDIHEIINLTDNVNSLPEQISKIRAEGGADIPEDWAGAYKKVNEEINWRNGTRVIFHLADAGAHGKLFTPYDKYPDEEQKLINELGICSEKKVKIFGFVIEEDSRNSFEKCKNIYSNKGGFYEICNFDKPKNANTGLFGSEKPKSIFGATEKKDYSGGLFGSKKEDNKPNCGLFGNSNEGKVENDNTLFGGLSPENKNNSNSKSSYNPYLNTSKGVFFNVKENKTEGSLFGNNNTNSLFGNNKIDNTNNKNNLFGNIKKEDNANNANSLFGYKKEGNANNTTSLFGNIKNDNNDITNIKFGFQKEDNANNTNSLFGNKKDDKINNTTSLFGNIKKDNSDSNNNLFANEKKDNNNNNAVGLFRNIKEDKENNNAGSLFGNKNENNPNNNAGNLFGNVKKDCLNSNNKGINKHEENPFQSKINSSFFNLVVNSIENINKKDGNLFNNNINNFNN